MTANLNMRSVQESVEDTTKQAMEYGRKAYLTYLGIWGMSYDGLKAVYQDRWMWVEKAEKRGKVVEKELAKVFQAYQKDFPGEVSKLATTIQHTATDFSKVAADKVEELAKSAEKTVAQVVRRDSGAAAMVEDIAVEAKSAMKNGAASAKKMAAKTTESVKAVAEQVEEQAELAVDKIWKGYDELGVKDIVAGLESMKMEKLEELRKYELEGKNRVTVLREIDARMQAMTS